MEFPDELPVVCPVPDDTLDVVQFSSVLLGPDWDVCANAGVMAISAVKPAAIASDFIVSPPET
jgi:hypothetical protein